MCKAWLNLGIFESYKLFQDNWACLNYIFPVKSYAQVCLNNFDSYTSCSLQFVWFDTSSIQFSLFHLGPSVWCNDFCLTTSVTLSTVYILRSRLIIGVSSRISLIRSNSYQMAKNNFLESNGEMWSYLETTQKPS